MLTRRQQLLVKLESGYGTDPSPTGAADAVLAYDLDLTQTGETLERPILPTMPGPGWMQPASCGRIFRQFPSVPMELPPTTMSLKIVLRRLLLRYSKI